MPYINIRVGKNLDPTQQQQLFSRTTSLMKRVMGKRAEVTVVHLQESEPHLWSTHAAVLTHKDPVGAYVDIKVTEGTNTPEEKSEMLSQTVKMLQETVGAIQEACYVVIDDIPADSWGYNGKSQAQRASSKL